MSNNSHTEFATTTWNDAQVIGDLNAPEVAEALKLPISTLCGFSKKQESGTWRAWKPSLGALIEKKLSLHETKRSKDGDAIVFASPVDEDNSEVLDTEEGSFALVGRRKNDIRSVSCAGFDIDTGASLEAAKEKLEELGYFAILYTTYNHGIRVSNIKKPLDVTNWDENTVLDIARERGFSSPIVDKIDRILGTALVKHDPVEKFRIILPLSHAFELNPEDSRRHRERCDEFRARMASFAKDTLGLEVDETGYDINRLFFTPRHMPSKKNWELVIYAGQLLDLEALPFDEGALNQRSSAGRRYGEVKTVSLGDRPYLSDGFDVLLWKMEFGHRFVATAFFEELGWEFRRGDGGDDEANISCPNDDAHSDAGNPNDQACWVRCGDGEDGFAISCRHNSCKDVRSAEMLMLVEQQVDLPDDYATLSEMLCAEHFYVSAVDDEPDVPARDEYLIDLDWINADSVVSDGSTEGNVSKAHNKLSIERACRAQMIKFSSGRFEVRSGFVCLVEGHGDQRTSTPVCDPFEVAGRTYSQNGDAQGRIVRFAADRIGNPVQEIIVENKSVIASSNEAVGVLVDAGLWVSGLSKAKNAVAEALSCVRPEVDIISVTRPGWHREAFLSPTGEVIGASQIECRLADNGKVKVTDTAGTLEGWNEAVDAALGCPNADFLLMGVLSGFMGVLTDLLEYKVSPILNFAGTTSRGKTTAQLMGATAWTTPLSGGLLVKFNTTMNGLDV